VTEQENLRELADKKGIFIGAAVNVSHLEKDNGYKEVLQREFNMVAPENAMKWSMLRPTKDSFNFDHADKLVSFAEENRMAVRGHTLIWDVKIPEWVTEGTRESEMLNLLEEHVATVAGRFKNKVYAWDVVNEPINDEGEFNDSPLFRRLGEKYIELAFKWAKAADPNAKLFLNDWGSDSINRRSNKLYEIVKGLLEKGVPIDGVGFQMHLGLGRSKTSPTVPEMSSIKENFQRFSDLGLELHITEMDIQIQYGVGSIEERLREQAEAYKNILETALEFPSFKALVQWGVNDKYSWITGLNGKEDAPLMFDSENQPKLAYFAIKDLLKE
jgi:endo-1,4-beta-xylanase